MYRKWTDCKPIPIPSPKDIVRFWVKVDRRGPDECWRWMASAFESGYGQFSMAGWNWKAHRIAFTLGYGYDPGQLLVLHTCDFPLCCNPAHLYRGSPADNADDAMERGRVASGDRNGSRLFPESRPRGEANTSTTLTDSQVLAMRSEYIPRIVTFRYLAAKYGITKSTSFRIITRKVWTHI